MLVLMGSKYWPPSENVKSEGDEEPQSMCGKAMSSDTSAKGSFLCSECGQPCLPRVSGKLNEFIPREVA